MTKATQPAFESKPYKETRAARKKFEARLYRAVEELRSLPAWMINTLPSGPHDYTTIDGIWDRVRLYSRAFPDRPALGYSNGWVTGTWAIGACYKNPNKLYGAYPHGYLERVHSMFPDAQNILHVFSGGLTLEAANIVAAKRMAVDKFVMTLVDSQGPEDGRYPTWQGDVCNMPEGVAGCFDLILADPPYSAEDCKMYGTKMPNIAKVMRELHRVAAPGANLVWLDQKWPMHRKDQWKTWGQVMLVRSTNHRIRCVSMFQKQ